MGFLKNNYGTDSFKPKFNWGVHKVTLKSYSVEESKKTTGYNVSVVVENETSESKLSLGWYAKIWDFSDFEKAVERTQVVASQRTEIGKLEDEVQRLKGFTDLRVDRDKFKSANPKIAAYLSLVTAIGNFEKFCVPFGEEVSKVVNDYVFKGDVKDLLCTYLHAMVGKEAYILVCIDESINSNTNRVYKSPTLSVNFNAPLSWSTRYVQEVSELMTDNEAGDQVLAGTTVVFVGGKNRVILIDKNNWAKVTPASPDQDTSNDTTSDIGDSYSDSDNYASASTDDLPF
jgi:hypothetical protein